MSPPTSINLSSHFWSNLTMAAMSGRDNEEEVEVAHPHFGGVIRHRSRMIQSTCQGFQLRFGIHICRHASHNKRVA
jgi:hypothetical protein